MAILAIDGGKNVGYALFTEDGEEIERGVIDFDDFFTVETFSITPVPNDWPELRFSVLAGERRWVSWTVTRLIVEGFRHDPAVKQGGSLHWASQVEGALRMVSAMSAVPLAVQYAGQALPVAKQITGYEEPRTKTGNKKHLPDQDSAWLHGRYWFHVNEIL